MNYETVIGLEVHVQLRTQTKLFCGCSTAFGSEPNTQVCPVCLGQPGVLPVLNRQALRYSVKSALALHCTIAEHTKFDRKNYYYPDLPKNYQISQYDMPYSRGGYLDIRVDGKEKRIGLTRIHLEEDAGKLVHSTGNYSDVDLNRTGTPLMEIVTEPDIRSPQEAYAFLTLLRLTLRYIGVSDCNMQEGSLRCDANISLRPEGRKELGTKVEIKNLNSFKAVQAALEYEMERQEDELDSGEKIIQETRLWDADRQETRSMRTKEGEEDYRYFPEPDLPPFTLSRDDVSDIRKDIRELPSEREKRFVEEYSIPAYDAGVIIQDREVADFFEACARSTGDAKEASNWVMGEIMRAMNDRKAALQDLNISADSLSDLIGLIKKGTVSKKIARESVFPVMLEEGKVPEEIVREKDLEQKSDAGELEAWITEAIEKNPKAVEDVRNGKKKAIGALVGYVMKQSKGQANPGMVNRMLSEKLQ
mgnify:CR=1 FL=1